MTQLAAQLLERRQAALIAIPVFRHFHTTESEKGLQSRLVVRQAGTHAVVDVGVQMAVQLDAQIDVEPGSPEHAEEAKKCCAD
jgi:hypothetical protein